MHVVPGKKPEFCFIAPTAYLPQYATHSSTHLVLAHLVATDEEYADFYRNLTNEHYIIMDNGAFELGESYDPSELLNLAENCGANAIVLPDYPGQHQSKTIAAAETLGPKFKEAGFDLMFVPQAEVGNLEGWIEAYQYAASNEHIDIIGMSILGIPNALQHISKPFSRVVMTQILIERGLFAESKHHHYLGLNSGPALEIPSLLATGALDSIDSSGPIWAGLLGHQYQTNTDSFQTVSKIHTPVQFDYPWIDNTDTQERIQWNVDLTLMLFDNL